MLLPLVVHWLDAPPIHVPCTAQHPLVRLRPLANDDVAALEEKRAFEMVVDALVMEKSVDVAYASDVVPTRNSPFTNANARCFASVPPLVSVRVS